MSTFTNLNPIESYTSDSYDAAQNYLRELWFTCHANGFAYAIFDGHQRQILKYHSFEIAAFFQVSPNTLQEYLDSIDVFLNDFKSIKLLFQNPNYTLTPAALFDEDDAAIYYKLKYILNDEEHLMTQRIPDFGAQLIYAIPRFMLNTLLSKFTDSAIREQVKVYHHVYALLSSLYYQTNHLNKEVCYVNISEQIFDVILIRNSSLQFCNTYPYNNPEDVLYFVMHAYQNNQLQPDAYDCYLSGDHSQMNEIRELLYTYIKNVRTLPLSDAPLTTLHPSTIFLLQHCA